MASFTSAASAANGDAANGASTRPARHRSSSPERDRREGRLQAMLRPLQGLKQELQQIAEPTSRKTGDPLLSSRCKTRRSGVEPLIFAARGAQPRIIMKLRRDRSVWPEFNMITIAPRALYSSLKQRISRSATSTSCFYVPFGKASAERMRAGTSPIRDRASAAVPAGLKDRM